MQKFLHGCLLYYERNFRTLFHKSFTDFCITNPEYKECPEYNNTQYAPPEYCMQHPDINRCAVFSGAGGLPWFLVTFSLSVYSCTIGITNFLRNGPFSVLSGMATARFGIAVSAVGSSLGTKVGFWIIYWDFATPLDNTEQGITNAQTSGTSVAQIYGDTR